MTGSPRNDDGGEALRRLADRQEFRRLVQADPLLSQLAARGHPDLPLRSTLVLGLLTLLTATASQDLLLAAVIGLGLLAGHLGVVHLMARRDLQGSRLLLQILRAGCGVASVIVALAALAPSPPAPVPAGPMVPAGATAGTTVGNASGKGTRPVRPGLAATGSAAPAGDPNP